MYNAVVFNTEQQYIQDFLAFPKDLYVGDTNYIPELRKDILGLLKGKHPCKGFLTQQNILVYQEKTLYHDGKVYHDKRVVCRAILFVNSLNKTGSIGSFECISDAAALQSLLDVAIPFFVEHNVTTIYAPMNGTMWMSYRLMTKGFEDKPFYGEPYNKAYYEDLFLKCGFTVAKRWESQTVKDLKNSPANFKKYQKLSNDKLNHGLSVAGLDSFDTDIKDLYKIVMNSFESFYLFHSIPEETFVELHKGMRYIIDRETIRIVRTETGEAVGFNIALPDYGDMFRQMRGELSFWQQLRFSLFKKTDRYTLLYLGIKQENGKTVYPLSIKALLYPVLTHLINQRKEIVCGMMGDTTKTKNFLVDYDSLHEYTLLKLDVK